MSTPGAASGQDPLAQMHVVVVGGSSGVGLAVAGLAASRGARLTLLARNSKRLDQAAASIGGAGVLTADLRDATSMEAVAGRLGDVDYLVITAGEYSAATIADSGPDQWREILEERLVGPMTLVKALAPSLSTSIVLTSGTVGQRPLPGSTWHSIVAAGVESATRALARELAPIRVNAVSPGAIHTPMLEGALAKRSLAPAQLAARLPVGRIGSPEDAAHAFLLAMTNPFMTGTTILLDGGSVLA